MSTYDEEVAKEKNDALGLALRAAIEAGDNQFNDGNIGTDVINDALELSFEKEANVDRRRVHSFAYHMISGLLFNWWNSLRFTYSIQVEAEHDLDEDDQKLLNDADNRMDVYEDIMCLVCKYAEDARCGFDRDIVEAKIIDPKRIKVLELADFERQELDTSTIEDLMEGPVFKETLEKGRPLTEKELAKLQEEVVERATLTLGFSEDDREDDDLFEKEIVDDFGDDARRRFDNLGKRMWSVGHAGTLDMTLATAKLIMDQLAKYYVNESEYENFMGRYDWIEYVLGGFSLKTGFKKNQIKRKSKLKAALKMEQRSIIFHMHANITPMISKLHRLIEEETARAGAEAKKTSLEQHDDNRVDEGHNPVDDDDNKDDME